MEHGSNEPSRKRRRLSTEEDDKNSSETGRRRSTRSSLLRPISPPPLRRNALSQSKQDQTFKAMSSPFQLTRIRDLPESSNVDTISLKDILGDPLIAECWEFNYLHDLDFLMDAFDEDVRGMVKVHVVHGFWKNDDQSRLDLKVSKTSDVRN
jgi:tyrosyl-DNA phosphodiesterase-1